MSGQGQLPLPAATGGLIPVAAYVRMSTEHQQYSTENQLDRIKEYAARRGMEIIRIFADEGKSGLSIKGRESLRQMIAEVEAGRAEFKGILAYDISRWGRFQDADESGYYEYICKRAGIAVSYERIFGDYLPGAEEIIVEDAYIRAHHQIVNFLRFCETAIRLGKPKRIKLVTKFDNQLEKDEAMSKLFTVADSLKLFGVALEIKENSALHDREVRLSNGWTVKIGRGFDFYQKPDDWLQVGANDLDLRPCLETNVDVIRTT